jgi:hypothetical protein
MPVARGNAILKPHIDENLPEIKDYTLRQWNNKCCTLATSAPDLVERDTFALTGHYTSAEDGQKYRAKLDFSGCGISRDMVIEQTCDIDSVLGVVMGEFPIAARVIFRYYMLSSFTHTLSANLHIPGVLVPDGDGDEEVSTRQHLWARSQGLSVIHSVSRSIRSPTPASGK